ncbi:hypothetical protein Tco_0299606 [Tanacetum coccineum]
MCHRGGEIDQDALLKTELLKTKDMVDKEIYNELSKRFLQLEKHCISLEIQIQQKEESFQSNKPCKNQEFPEFREFFVINDLKAQLLARTTLICNLKKQIKSVKETSNEATVKNDIDVIETINIELEHSVAKLLAANEQLHKENEHLKQTYKELFDSIKKTKVQNKDNSESLISQINQKSVENADLKAQLQEKVFANAALKNELRKIKGNSVDTKFAKASILGKPPLQPSRNHLVVRQPNAFTSERPRISRPRFASQVDEKNDLSKTVTPHYLPKVRESAAATPHQVNAPNYSRNSHKESYGSNDMVHAYFLEDARKMTQDKTRIPSHKDMASTRAHCTPNACTPKPRNIYRSSPVSKCSGGMSNGEPLVDHSRNSSFFLDSKQLVCSICHKYIFNTNHDDCITKILNKVNSRAKVQSPKIRNNNPVEPKNHTHKPGRQNGIGQRFSLNKSSAVHEKPHTPRSCLRWKPTGRIFKTVRLRWIPTGKVFIDSTTKVDSEPPNGSNDDITNPYECNQTLYVSAGTSNSSAVAQPVLEADVQDTPSTSISQTIKEAQSHVIPTSVEEDDHGFVVEHRGRGGGSVDVVSVVSVTLEGTSADAVRALKIWINALKQLYFLYDKARVMHRNVHKPILHHLLPTHESSRFFIDERVLDELGGFSSKSHMTFSEFDPTWLRVMQGQCTKPILLICSHHGYPKIFIDMKVLDELSVGFSSKSQHNFVQQFDPTWVQIHRDRVLRTIFVDVASSGCTEVPEVTLQLVLHLGSNCRAVGTSSSINRLKELFLLVNVHCRFTSLRGDSYRLS